jgi:hypothetical protein
MRWQSVSATACSFVAALALSGCGSTVDRPPVVTALRLAQLAEDVAAGRGCGGPLVAAVIAAINRKELPPSLQESVLSDANEIAATCSRPLARKLAARLSP